MKKSLLLLIFLLAFQAFPVLAATDSCASLPLGQRADCYNQKLIETQGQERSLSQEITRINNQISLTRVKIDTTEQKIGQLTNDIASVSGKINLVEDSLVRTSDVLANRIAKTYMAGRADPLIYLLTSADFPDFWQKLEYLRIIQKHDKQLLMQMAATRKNYNDQKDLLEDRKKQVEILQAQLKSEKAQLDRQNREKQSLLEVTRNDETRYQQLLAEAQRELSALQASQFTGKKSVKKGDVLGYMGSSGFSTGPHLHFGVYNLSESQANNFDYVSGANNPLDSLRGRSLPVDGSACSDKHSGDSFGNGGWDWPMNNPTISQCYGKTPFSWVYSNGFHEGVDMWDTADTIVRAVDDGVAYFYRGSSSLGNNVRVFHGNNKMTLYLHLQ